jgi:SP family general alpha glucoside:H+ symporter-like MFS transporter
MATSMKAVNSNLEAKEAAQVEKSMTLTQAIKLYPKAIGWSVLLSTAIVMEGYDLSLLGNFYAFPPFTKKYGVLTPGSNPPSYQVCEWNRGCELQY